jgi:Methyltransferase domain
MLQYTKDWTTSHIPEWLVWLDHLRGAPGVRMAEIGCFEGRSTRWFVENLNPETMACVDNWSGSRYDTWKRNTQGLLCVTWVGEESWYLLSRYHQYDLIYLDADHKPSSVLIDACNAWQALKPGGTLIFDDYRLVDASRGVNVKVAVDSFCYVMGLMMHHSPWPKPEYPDDWGQVMVRKSL